MRGTGTGRRAARRAELGLLIAAALLLSVYTAAVGYSHFSQAYYDWAFERLLLDQPAPVTQFVREKLFGTLNPEPTKTVQPHVPRKTPRPAPGALLGRLEIPSVGLSVMVVEGTGQMALTEGVGHIEGTALPGHAGNAGFAGHRDTYFRALKDIGKQDLITLTTVDGTFRYKVEETRVVYPSATSVLDRTPDSTLTLVTCFPFYYVGQAPKRFIVKARLVG